ncbi:flagellar biosynthetic protein FliO [Arsukibacterium perlucidum]|uniref:flagellar biosynthetic protein FliO n=1 Tax=Arsukibacterium perlucidum TaxID=368811 RepID=UPI00036D3527|nr:flagellar biosynthetic protein FliO [Arsukibacterium perlucidum]
MQPLIKTVITLFISLLLVTAAGASAQPETAEQQKQTASAAADADAALEQRTEPEVVAEQAEQADKADSQAVPRQSLPFQRQEPATERTANSGISLGKIAISLAAVLLLVVALGWLFKKLTMRLPGTQHVKVICSVPLGQRERLLVIEIQGKQRVLGVTPHSINMLFELENSLPETKLASDFHTQLQSFLKK